MVYYNELLLKFYKQLSDYYKNHPNEFSSLPNEKNFLYGIQRNKYYLINDPSFNYSDIYQNINNYSFDFDFVASCLEKSDFIKLINYHQGNIDNSKIQDFVTKEFIELDNNINQLITVTIIMSYFVKMIRLYYQKDFMQNSELIDSISKMKHRINLLYTKTKPAIIYNKSMSQDAINANIKEKKMLLMDGISEIIDSSSYNDLVLKQQKLYLKEFEKIDVMFQQMGNKLQVTAAVFQIFNQFIQEFKDLASKRIISLEESRKK